MIKSIGKKVVFTALFCFASATSLFCQNQDSLFTNFVESFIKHYGFNSFNRYGHEYHPFILEKTAQSMDQLESAFKANGFSMLGRYMLMGYEENAFPSFFTRVRDCQGQTIDDEASFKDPRGWSIQLHNRFGTMSGFLFRAVNLAQEQNGQNLFNHINPKAVEIFSSGIELLQQHSFGQMCRTMFQLEREIFEHVEKGQWREVLEKLIFFWTALYNGEYKTGDQQVAGTQDILFSIENAKFLKNSSLDLIKFFTGPDITYPIVVSKTCSQEATKNAQDFIATFSKELKPVNRQPTLYVFRSFVDGVGKSTLLGNIKNWIEFKDDVDKYRIIDNSSTLESELFKFDDNVFIADLPAQMSHFTYKPNGIVWVDQKAINTDDTVISQAVGYFCQNKDDLKAKYDQQVKEVEETIAKTGSANTVFSDAQRPELGFIRNLIILKELDRNVWIPFSIKEQHFLGNLSDPSQIRVLTEIKNARSEGLKNVDAAQMIFNDGLMLPANYDDFVNNLIGQAKELNIKNVVFVDFLSMYSRSSRENIRINYLLQLMGLLKSEFDPFKTLYRNFVSNSELLAMLMNKNAYEHCRNSLELETLVRFALYSMMQEKIYAGRGTQALSEDQVTSFINDFLKTLSQESLAKLKDIVEIKISSETEHLYKTYKNTKEFVNLHNLDFEKIRRFSNFIEHFFTKVIRNNIINSIWENLDGDIISPLPFEDGWIKDPNCIATLESGNQVRLLCVISEKNRDPAVISKFLRTIRSAWYSSILNILVAHEISPDEQAIFTNERIAQIPVLIKKDKTGRICLVEKELELDHEDIDAEASYQRRKFKDSLYLANYCYPSTAYGIFGFGTDVGVNKFQNYTQGYVLTSYLELNKFGASSNRTIDALHVWNENCSYLLSLKDMFFREREFAAKKSGQKAVVSDSKNEELEKRKILEELDENIQNNVNSEDERDSSEVLGFNLNSHYNPRKKQHHIIIQTEALAKNFEIFARMIVTLESIARDLDSSIVVGQDRESFFAGLKLVEEVLLGQELGVSLKHQIFTDPSERKCLPIVDLESDFAGQ